MKEELTHTKARSHLLVGETLIVGNKSVETLVKVHGRRLLASLRLTNQPSGLFINFGAATVREGVKRIVDGPAAFMPSRLRVTPPSFDANR